MYYSKFKNLLIINEFCFKKVSCSLFVNTKKGKNVTGFFIYFSTFSKLDFLNIPKTQPCRLLHEIKELLFFHINLQKVGIYSNFLLFNISFYLSKLNLCCAKFNPKYS